MAEPAKCRSMTELRETIDGLDAELMRLLARRAACIDRAIELKRAAGLPARIDARVEEVAANARRNATAAGFDPEFAERLWRQLIDWSIAREARVLDRTK
ncbi:chorismate mutase [Maritimibacter sp. 55A14]|uniref:chorismate mutase n=1 Tax=Maritimibacter sp. 55A14 TaxID=2174844 RepID=UPI000D60BB6D|nr:chorismate mutase [Maritimibacter sp. 55A14]PWE32069.1 chorismate mutase [Maritimibacter sp. 55A14]